MNANNTKTTKKDNQADVTRVTYRWDDQPGVDAGWYCQSFDEGNELMDDSQKVWFPVNVDNYGEDEEDELVEALQEAFPHAEIVHLRG
jgi:hypothetical protein